MANNKESYVGFSSKKYEKSKTFICRDIEIVKEDILNHIFTRRGERVMMGSFGTRIPDLVMEPMDNITIGEVYEELVRVFNFDPRVELRSEIIMRPLRETKTLVAMVDVNYKYLNLNEQFDINIQFEKNN